MRILGNILWFILGGFAFGLAHVFAGVLFCVTVVGVPFGVQCFKLAALSFFPFGREIVFTNRTTSIMGSLGNLLWILLFGFWIAVAEFFTGIAFCITIVGIPFGLQYFKLAKLTFLPFGSEIVHR